jgi:hypothetical protein
MLLAAMIACNTFVSQANSYCRGTDSSHCDVQLDIQVGGHAYHAREDHDRGRTERIKNLHLCWFLTSLPRSALRRQPEMTPQQTCSHFTVCRMLQRVAGFVRLLHDAWVL